MAMVAERVLGSEFGLRVTGCAFDAWAIWHAACGLLMRSDDDGLVD
jgi:hypothetical protein